LSQYAGKHPDFYEALISNFHPEKKANFSADYEKEIQKCFNIRNINYYDRYDYSSEGNAISYNLIIYIEKAKSLIIETDLPDHEKNNSKKIPVSEK
jgi:hypothetical protein